MLRACNRFPARVTSVLRAREGERASLLRNEAAAAPRTDRSRGWGLTTGDDGTRDTQSIGGRLRVRLVAAGHRVARRWRELPGGRGPPVPRPRGGRARP